MANEVEIRVVTKDDSKKGLQSAERGIKGLGDQAERAEVRTRRFGGGLDHVSKRAGGLETGMSGVADGISGVSTIMEQGATASADTALAFADIGSSATNAAIPAVKGLGRGLSGLKGLAKGAGSVLSGDLLGGLAKAAKGSGNAATGIGGLVGRLGGLKSVLVGGGIIAGIGLAVVGLKALTDNSEAAARRADEFFTALKRGEPVSEEFTRKMIFAMAASDGLDRGLRKVANESGLAAAEGFVRAAREAGLSGAAMAELETELRDLRAEFDGVSDAAARAAEAHKRYTDQITGVLDPVLAAIESSHSYQDALAAEAAAQADLDAKKASGTATAAELAAAERALRDAHLGVTTAALGDRDAQDALRRAVDSGEITAGEMSAALQRLEADGYGSSASAAFLRAEIAKLKSKNVDLTVTTYGTGMLGSAKALLDSINSKRVDLTVNYRTFVKREELAHGGIKGAATGGPRGGPTLVGERGVEAIDLPAGSRVRSNANTRSMLAGGGPTEIVLRFERTGDPILDAFVQGLRGHIKKKHGGDVQVALGR